MIEAFIFGSMVTVMAAMAIYAPDINARFGFCVGVIMTVLAFAISPWQFSF